MNNYGGDSAVFILLAKMFHLGKIPYVDFFDHKGPTLIFIEAMGLQLADNDRTSIFILQIINLFITQVLIYKIAKVYLPTLISLAVVMLTLLAFSFTIQGGNSSEELSLPYLYLSILITICLDNYSATIQKICFAIIGMSASILFWMRLNNMGVLCACILFIIIIALKYKNWKQIYNLIIGVSIGFLLISLPILVYFIRKGALHEMIYASFIFNFKYIHYNLDQPFSLVDLVKGWISLAVLIIGTILYYKKYRDSRMFIFCILLFLIGLITTHIGPKYFHYMTLNLPLFSLGVIQIFSAQKSHLQSPNSNILIFATTLILLFGYTFYKKNQDQYMNDQDDTLFIRNSTDIIDKIPVNQRISVFTYNVPPRFWLINNALPNYKFFTNQDWHGSHDKNILTETNQLILQNPPVWIVIANDSTTDKTINPQFYAILAKTYKEVYQNTSLILLYKAIDK